jgi:hypothetical protein
MLGKPAGSVRFFLKITIITGLVFAGLATGSLVRLRAQGVASGPMFSAERLMAHSRAFVG